MYDENFIKYVSDEKRNQIVSWYIDWRNAYPQCLYEYKIWFKWPSYKGYPILEYSVVAYKEKNNEIIQLAKIDEIFLCDLAVKSDDLEALDGVNLCTHLKDIGDHWIPNVMDFAKLMSSIEKQVEKSPFRNPTVQ